ncbi:MAG: site-specific integrase, partial [Thermoleophilaceae bacterium]|nr:site-specific integrase [Thermoleophilaceae bacterium]
LQAGQRAPVTRAHFDDYARAWIASYSGRTQRGLKERTRESYRRVLELHAIPFFAGYRLADIDPPAVRAFIAKLSDKGLEPPSIRAALAPVKALLSTAVEDGALRVNPATGVRIGTARKKPPRQVRALTRVELYRLLEAVPKEWRLLFELLAHTGLRFSEAAGLEWRDLDYRAEGRSHLHIRRQFVRGDLDETLKSENGARTLPLAGAMAARLWQLGADEPESRPIFTSEIGRRLDYSNMHDRVLQPAREASGLEWATFHTLRHTCASLLFEAGWDVLKVSRFLGHADASFTLRTYIHLVEETLGDPDFLDGVGDNPVAADGPQTAADAEVVDVA